MESPDREQKRERFKKTKEKVRQFILAGLMLETAGLTYGDRPNYDLRHKEQEIHKIFGPFVNVDELKKDRPPAEKLDGVEPLRGIDADISHEEVLNFLNTFPRNWVEGEITSITNEEETPQHGDYDDDSYNHYKEKEDRFTLALAIPDSKGSIGISFRKPAEGLGLRFRFYSVLAHELGHGNDWQTDNVLTYQERTDLLLKIYERTHSPNRLQSAYVERVRQAYDNPRQRSFRLAQEYWAEIEAQYFEDPTKLHIDDFMLVDTSVRKNDPSYNWHAGFLEREKIIARIYENNSKKPPWSLK